MDSILIIKSFLIGIIWAGSFYTLASFVVPIFPMPLFLYIRKLLTNYTDEMAQHNEAKGISSLTLDKFTSAISLLTDSYLE